MLLVYSFKKKFMKHLSVSGPVLTTGDAEQIRQGPQPYRNYVLVKDTDDKFKHYTNVWPNVR